MTNNRFYIAFETKIISEKFEIRERIIDLELQIKISRNLTEELSDHQEKN